MPFLAITQGSESDFIKETSHEYDKQENLKIEKLKANKKYQNIKGIKLGKLSKAIDKGRLKFNLPGVPGVITVTADYLEAVDDSEYFLWGKIAENGYVMLRNDKEGFSGKIVLGTDSYAIINISDKKSIVTKVEPDNSGTCPEISIEEDTEGLEEKVNLNERNNCGTMVSILVLYTNAADSHPLNEVTVANDVLNDLKTITRNSGLRHDIQFKINGIHKLMSFTEEDDIELTWNNLKNSFSANSLRSSTGSDIVLLLTDNNYDGGILGIAATDATDPNAFALVNIDHASSSLLGGAHEIGHILGGRHQLCSTSTAGSCSNYWSGVNSDAHGAGVSVFNTTIMHAPANNLAKIMHYSNPNVNVVINGTTFSTGGSNQDVAERIRQRAPVISCFESDGYVQAGISGPQFIYAHQNNTWSPNVTTSNVTYPLSYFWERSQNGVNNWTQVSTGPYYTANTGSLPSYFTLRLTVSSFDGKYDVAFKQVTSDNIEKPFEEQVLTRSNNSEAKGIVIFPNPASTTINVRGPSGNYFIKNTYGQILRKISIAEERTYQISLDEWPAGIYFLESIAIDHHIITKFIKS